MKVRNSNYLPFSSYECRATLLVREYQDGFVVPVVPIDEVSSSREPLEEDEGST
jgi:hypothetical protein